ncbi:MAG: Ig-like domain-containing protein [Clostridia bacterium]|nr:Ig-like domain-containing protein [Clostridia bacterium]
MKKKLLTALLALVLVFAGALGITTMASAEAELSVVDVNFTNYAGFAGDCIAVNFGAKTGEDWEDHTAALSSYVSLVDKDGKAYDVKFIDTQGNYLMINRNQGYTAAVGDVLTLKAGLTLDCGTLAKDVSYVYSTAGAPFTLVVEKANEVDLKINQLNGGDNVSIDFSKAWGFTTVVTIRFDRDNWGGDLGTYYGAHGINEGKVGYVDAFGNVVALDDMLYVNDGHFIARTNNTITPGSKFFINKGFKLEIGGVTAVMAEDHVWAIISTEGHALPVFNEAMVPTAVEITNSLADKDVMVGATMQVAYALPEGTYGTAKFASSNEEVATVSATGVVTGVAEGTATITVTVGAASDTFDVNVIPASEVTGVEIVNQYTYYVIKGEEAVLPALKACAVFEGGAKGTEFDLVVGENLTVPTVDTAEVGAQTIELTVNYKGTDYTVNYNVEVYEPYDMTIKEIGIVEWFAFAVFVQYPDSTTNIANITATNNVNNVAEKIKYTRADGTEIGFGFYVLGGGNIAMFMQFGEGVTLDINNYNEYYQVGDVITLEAGLCGWKWTGELKATATDNAAIAEGTGMYIVECVLKETVQFKYDGNVWGFFLEYEDFEVAETEKTMNVGDVATVGAARVPAKATSGTITYESSNPEIAEVSERGVITAKAEGTVTITAKIDGGAAGEIVKTVTVTVQDVITGIKFEETSLSFVVGATFDVTTLKAKYEYASGKVEGDVDFTNATVAGLDLTAENAGTAVITVVVNGQTVSGAISYTVKPEEKGCFGAFGFESILAFAAFGIVAALRKKN